MRLILWSIVAAALAPIGSAAPTVVAGEAITTTELPARFAMYLVIEEARANGLRIGYANSEAFSRSLLILLVISVN